MLRTLTVQPEQLEVRNRRAERVGLPIDQEEEEKKKRRMERFGSVRPRVEAAGN